MCWHLTPYILSPSYTDAQSTKHTHLKTFKAPPLKHLAADYVSHSHKRSAVLGQHCLSHSNYLKHTNISPKQHPKLSLSPVNVELYI